MKKFLKIGVGIVALGAAGWSGLWFAGKGEIQSRMEAEAANLDAQGWTLSWGEQEISGFPVGYTMNLTDVAVTDRMNGMLVMIGDVTASADAGNPDRIVSTLPPEVKVTIPTRAELLAVNPDLPKSIEVTIESRDLTIAAEGLDPLSRTVDLAAKGLALEIDQDDFPWKIATAADDVVAALKAKPEGHSLTFTAARHITTFENADDPTQPLMKFDYFGPTITADAAARTIEEFLSQFVADADNLLSGTFVGTGQEIIISVVEPSVSQEAQVMTYKAGASSGLFGLSGGEVTYQAEDREVDLAVYMPGVTSPALKNIRTQSEAYQRNLKLPVSAEDPKDSALRVALIGVTPDDAFWEAIDPGKSLNRDSSALLADLQGTIKYVTPHPGGLPFELSNVTVKELQLDTLGAKAKVVGDVEILQPINLPYGEFKVDVSGAKALLASLSQAELINLQIRQMAEAILQVYAKPAEGEDTWTTDIVMDHEGVKINGLKMPGQ